MNARLMRIKKHFVDNKKTYLACGATAVVTAAAILLEMDRKGDGVNKALSVGWKPRTDFQSTTINLIERSTPSRPVHLVGTNLYFESLNEAARQTGHSLSQISRHVNGHIPSVKGDVFEVLELAT